MNYKPNIKTIFQNSILIFFVLIIIVFSSHTEYFNNFSEVITYCTGIYIIALIASFIIWGFQRLINKFLGKDYCKWSIGALIFAFIGGLFGIVFAIIALFKIKKDHNLKGKKLAIIAIIIAIPMSFIWISLDSFDPEEFLSEYPIETQVEIRCLELCHKDFSTQNTSISSDPDKPLEYICSCLDQEGHVLGEYDLFLEEE